MLLKNQLDKLIIFFIIIFGFLISTAPYFKFYAPIYYFFLIIIIIFSLNNYKNIFHLNKFEILFYFFLLISLYFLIFHKTNFSFDIHFIKIIFILCSFFLLFKLISFRLFHILIISFIIFSSLNSLIAILQIEKIYNAGLTFFLDLRFLFEYPKVGALKDLSTTKIFFAKSPSGISYTNIQMSYQIVVAFFLLKYLNYLNFFEDKKKLNLFIHSIFYINIVLSGLTVLFLFILYDLLKFIIKSKTIKLLKVLIIILISITSIFISSHFEINKKFLERLSLWEVGVRTIFLKERNPEKRYFETREEVFNLLGINESRAIYFRDRGPHNSIITASRQINLNYMIFQIFFHFFVIVIILTKIKNELKFYPLVYFINTMFHNSGLANYDLYAIILMNIIFYIINNDKNKKF